MGAKGGAKLGGMAIEDRTLIRAQAARVIAAMAAARSSSVGGFAAAKTQTGSGQSSSSSASSPSASSSAAAASSYSSSFSSLEDVRLGRWERHRNALVALTRALREGGGGGGAGGGATSSSYTGAAEQGRGSETQEVSGQSFSSTTTTTTTITASGEAFRAIYAPFLALVADDRWLAQEPPLALTVLDAVGRLLRGGVGGGGLYDVPSEYLDVDSRGATSAASSTSSSGAAAQGAAVSGAHGGVGVADGSKDTSSSVDLGEEVRNLLRVVLGCSFADVAREREEVVALHVLKVCQRVLRSPVFGRFVGPRETVAVFDAGMLMLAHRPATEVFLDAVADRLRAWMRDVLLGGASGSGSGSGTARASASTREGGGAMKTSASVGYLSALHDSTAPAAHGPAAQNALRNSRACALLERLCDVISAVHHHYEAPTVGGTTAAQHSQAAYVVAVDLLSTFVEAYADRLDTLPRGVLQIITDDLCPRMVAGLETPNHDAFAATLRTLLTIYATPVRRRLKYQLELFFRALLQRVLENAAAPAANRDVALEALVELSANSDFTAELWVNFDCCPSAFDVLEHLCRYLYRNAFPPTPHGSSGQAGIEGHQFSAAPSHTHLLCLEGLLLTLQNVRSQQRKHLSAQGSQRHFPGSTPGGGSSDDSRAGSAALPPAEALRLPIDETTSAVALRSIKSAKTLLQTGLDHFASESPDAGLRFMVAEGILPAALDTAAAAGGGSASGEKKDGSSSVSSPKNSHGLPDPQAAARLLHSHNALVDKKVLGTFFGSRGDFPQSVLEQYVKIFIASSAEQQKQRRDGGGSGSSSAEEEKEGAAAAAARAGDDLLVNLRSFLESFRLPGEAPIISRIFEKFSEVYWAHHKLDFPSQSPFENPDVVYVVCYSLLMLNVDLHNKAVKEKMSLSDFKKRTNDTVIVQEGVTGPLADDVLEAMFHSILNEEITLPDDRLPGTEPAALGGPESSAAHMSLSHVTSWHSLVRRSHAEPFICDVAPSLMRSCAQDVFGVVWRPSIAALTVVLERSVAIAAQGNVNNGNGSSSSSSSSGGGGGEVSFADQTDGLSPPDIRTRVLASALEGLSVLCDVSVAYGMHEPVDAAVIVLATHCGLQGLLSADRQGASTTSSSGRGSRRRRIAAWAKNAAHVATTRAMFAIVAKNSMGMRHSWKNFLQCMVACVADKPLLAIASGSVYAPKKEDAVAGGSDLPFLRDYARADAALWEVVSSCRVLDSSVRDEFLRSSQELAQSRSFSSLPGGGSLSSRANGGQTANDSANTGWGSWIGSFFGGGTPPRAGAGKRAVSSAPSTPASTRTSATSVRGGSGGVPVHSTTESPHPISTADVQPLSPALHAGDTTSTAEAVAAPPHFPDDLMDFEEDLQAFWNADSQVLLTDIVVGDELKLGRAAAHHVCAINERAVQALSDLSPDSMASLIRACTMQADAFREKAEALSVSHLRRELFLFETVCFAAASNPQRSLFLWVFVREFVAAFFRWLAPILAQAKTTLDGDSPVVAQLRIVARRAVSGDQRGSL